MLTTIKIRTIIIYYIVWIFLLVFMKRIESRNNPTIKNIVSLNRRREREEQKLFFFEGVHLLEEYLRFGHKPLAVFLREDVSERYKDLVILADCEVYEVTESVYDKMTEEKSPQGILTVAPFLENVVYAADEEGYQTVASAVTSNSLMLVDLQDNGNVGTVIRTSAALGCAMLLCGNCADVYSPKTVRATMGALFSNDVFVCKDPIKTVSALRISGKRVIASALTDNALELGNFELKETDCFAVGNEGNGLSSEFIDECDITAIIKMSCKTESLNAASAASILLWEAKRGRL